MKSTRKSYLVSALSVLLCIALLIGTTFAWFTDHVTSGTNVIKSGNLDLKMYWTNDPENGTWHDVEDPAYNTVFSHDNWEPGYTEVKYLKIKNNGSLALNYKLHLTPVNGVGKLAEVINVYFANKKVLMEERSDLSKLGSIGLLNNVLEGGATVSGTILADGQTGAHPSGEVILTFAMNMLTTAGNEYQGESVGDGFAISALASQSAIESDSFNSNYDVGAEYPALIIPRKITVPVTPVDNKVPAGGLTLSEGDVSATLPAGTLLEPGVTEITLTTELMDSSSSNIVAVEEEKKISLDVHIAGVSEDNTVPIAIDLGAVLPKYLNMGNYYLYHVEDGVSNPMTLVNSKADLTAHNTFTYNPETGAVSVAMASFSEVALLSDTTNQWAGNFDYKFSGSGTAEKPYKIFTADELAGLGQIVGGMGGKTRNDYSGKYFKLMADIDLGDAEGANPDLLFYPIGYYYTTNHEGSGEVYSTVYSFSGTFDGNGHTIKNFYQNTWEMDGDYNEGYPSGSNHYKDAMGLFGYVNGGTVKNLTVDHFSSDGEFTPTGSVAAFACDATFENIAVTNCNPRVYNTGNGGIVGIGGNSDDTNAKKLTFTNITVDNTNKITALWGSWDVACGGLIGMFRGNSEVNFKNCHAAAQIDAYNDVCGNYQYYWYRYSGMMIGSIRKHVTDGNGYTIPDMTGISAEGCTVHYGDWNNYYYCELVANSLASYTHDHQFSRLTEVKSVDVSNKTYVPLTSDTPVAIPASGRYNFVVVKGEDATENATCYHFVDGKQWKHEDAGYENGIDEDGDGANDLKEDKQHVYLPFKDQLFQGYGWGVKHIPITDYAKDGKIIVLDKTPISVQKFKTNANAPTEVVSASTMTIGEFFEAIALPEYNVPIKNNQIQVFVSPVEVAGSASCKFVQSTTNDWKEGKITFSGSGDAMISITDYYFCKTTTIKVFIGQEDVDIGVGDEELLD